MSRGLTGQHFLFILNYQYMKKNTILLQRVNNNLSLWIKRSQRIYESKKNSGNFQLIWLVTLLTKPFDLTHVWSKLHLFTKYKPFSISNLQLMKDTSKNIEKCYFDNFFLLSLVNLFIINAGLVIISNLIVIWLKLCCIFKQLHENEDCSQP